MMSTTVVEFKPTCDLCDEMGEKARVPEGVVWRSYGGKSQFCGYAVTIQCLDNDNTLVREMVESSSSRRGRVLVVDAGGSTRCALLGDRLAGLAFANQWAGIVIYGCVRDVDALATIDIGIQATGHTPRKSTPQLNTADKQAKGTDVVVQIGNVSVSTGDAVYADNDGVVFVRRQDVVSAP